jgi:hypothetical protein
MIKETIPELKKLSTADKFALAVELWDELSFNPDANARHRGAVERTRQAF